MNLNEYILREAGITDGIRKVGAAAVAGFKDAQRRVQDAEKKANDERAAKEKAERDAKAAAETERKAAAAAKKEADAKSAVNIQKEIQEFINDFFDKFPYKEGLSSVEEMKKKYPTPEAALAAFKAYDAFAVRAEQLLKGLNKSAVAAGYAEEKQVKRYMQTARKIINGISALSKNPRAMYVADEDGVGVNQDLINFVRAEASMFKRMIRIKDDFRIDDDLFKRIISQKMNKTAQNNKLRAVAALNHIIVYIIHQIRGRARNVSEAGRQLADEAEKKGATSP